MTTRTSQCTCGQLTLTYDGPDPERISICQCNNCHRRTGSMFSVQTRFPREHVKIEGESSTWTFPVPGAEPVTFRSCDSGGATYHRCPECGAVVYWEMSIAPEVWGANVGGFTDPTFPPPMISGFEVFGAPWVMNISELEMAHFQNDGTSHGGARA
jgi:hypothetical protein